MTTPRSTPNHRLRPTLRGAFASTTIIVAALALLAATALVLMTTRLHETSAALAAGVESVRLAEETEIDLLLHVRAVDPLVQRSIEGDLQRRVASAGDYVTTEEESNVVAEAALRVDEYVRAARDAQSPALVDERLDVAYRALEDLVAINVAQARAEQRSAAAFNRLANIFGLGGGTSIVVLACGFLWWLRARAFRPVLALAEAMERYTAGDFEARADTCGPAELADMAERFNAMADALAARRAAQGAFLAGVAHDLRSPLAAMKMSATLLGPDGPLPSEARIRRTLEIFHRQITRLDRLVGDLLDRTSIEAGHFDLHPVDTDVAALVRDTAELFATATHSHRLVVSVPRDAVPLRCDPVRIEQVLSNLLSNAIKYSPEGTEIAIGLMERGDGVVLSVRDQGIGIPEDEISRLFQPFRRLTDRHDAVPGIGLGLFVVQRIVHAHGGRIEVSSNANDGSEFRVILPKTEPQVCRQEAVATQEREQSSA